MLRIGPRHPWLVKAYQVIVCCSYVAGLFASAHDTHSGVRKAVCAGLVQMLQLQPERLAPHMEQIIEYMLESTQVSLPLWCMSACRYVYRQPVVSIVDDTCKEEGHSKQSQVPVAQSG